MRRNITVIIENPELASALGFKVGAEISVSCRQGVPVNREWRNRFKDAVIDGCISFPQNTPKTKKEDK